MIQVGSGELRNHGAANPKITVDDSELAVWVRGRHCGAADRFNRFPEVLAPAECLCSLRDYRIRLYEQIGDHDEARVLFLDPRECMQTSDEKPQRRLRGTIAILREWIDSEFAEAWPVVRERITAFVAKNDASEPGER